MTHTCTPAVVCNCRGASGVEMRPHVTPLVSVSGKCNLVSFSLHSFVSASNRGRRAVRLEWTLLAVLAGAADS
jgi:hypothetical protein